MASQQFAHATPFGTAIYHHDIRKSLYRLRARAAAANGAGNIKHRTGDYCG